MQVLWEQGPLFVKEIIPYLPEPKPHYNSVSTITRVLEDKGFLSHVSYGKTHQYYPLISKSDYQQMLLSDVVSKYFDDSYSSLVSYFADNEKIDAKELQTILDLIKIGRK
jgi:predicted transcriptional regulator